MPKPPHPAAMPWPHMHRRHWLAWAALGLGQAQSQAAQEPPLRILTEEYPPYNYTDQGRITGLATQVVQASLQAAGLQGQIQSLPWARAYQMAQETPNVLIYSIGRSAEREKIFQWVGVVAPTQYYLFAHPARVPAIQTLEDAKTLQLASVNEDLAEQFLLSHGFVKGKNLQSSNKHDTNYEKLKQGRVDLWLMNELTAYHMARQAGDQPAQTLAKLLPVPELGSGGYYMAFGNATPGALVERLRKGLESIKRQGIYEQLLQKWL